MTTKAHTAPGTDPEAPVAGGDGPDPGRAGCRPMRADAVKNRQRILDAAEAIFATEGLAVPIDAVAERAGVGVGTLYRHFPTKEALFEAIVAARLEDLLELAKARAGAGDPGDALFAFLGEFAHQASAKHDLFDALSSAGIDIKSSCAEMVDEMKRSIDVLRQRAVAAEVSARRRLDRRDDGDGRRGLPRGRPRRVRRRHRAAHGGDRVRRAPAAGQGLARIGLRHNAHPAAP